MKLNTFVMATSLLLAVLNLTVYLLMELNGGVPPPGIAPVSAGVGGSVVIACGCLVYGLRSIPPTTREGYLLSMLFLSIVLTAIHHFFLAMALLPL